MKTLSGILNLTKAPILLMSLLSLLISGCRTYSERTEFLQSYYPSVREVSARMEALAEANPKLITLITYGESVEGRPLKLLRFSLGGDKARALFNGAIHANEQAGVLISLALTEELARDAHRKGSDANRALCFSDIDIIPLVNPDGYFRVQETNGRGGARSWRKNANGVDLNRNFPVEKRADGASWKYGNDNPESDYYRGPYPLSEPEARALAELTLEQGYFFSMNFHTVMGQIRYPWSHSQWPTRDEDLFLAIAEEYQSHQMRAYPAYQSGKKSAFLGAYNDFHYQSIGGLSLTVETGTLWDNAFDLGLVSFNTFWYANPLGRIDFWVENDLAGLLPALIKAYELTGGSPLGPR